MDDKQILDRVLDFATKAHGDQKRKYTPEPYIVHPVRVMELCKKHGADICMLSAALLHDVLEDTPMNKEELKQFLDGVMTTADAQRTLKLVVELTDVYIKENYPGFNRRKRKEMERDRVASTSADSQTIKYADTIDNCREITEHDPDFARVFLNECKTMLKNIPNGDPQLYQIAREMVDKALEKSRRARSGA
jgi:(p)ppGpp synthase/HD superfamily hydrolase